jgi:trk system potassium uptake protein TrkH
MIASIAATLKGRGKAELFHHSVPEETVHRVASIILLSVAALVGGIFLLLITEDGSFVAIAFDAVSAFGTVGLSHGLTGPGTTMTALGKLIITALMFIGRLGPVTLVLGVAQMRDRATYKYPEDTILVG